MRPTYITGMVRPASDPAAPARRVTIRHDGTRYSVVAQGSDVVMGDPFEYRWASPTGSTRVLAHLVAADGRRSPDTVGTFTVKASHYIATSGKDAWSRIGMDFATFVERKHARSGDDSRWGTVEERVADAIAILTQSTWPQF